MCLTIGEPTWSWWLYAKNVMSADYSYSVYSLFSRKKFHAMWRAWVKTIVRRLQNRWVTEAMVLSLLLSNSLLPICLRNLTRVTLTRDFIRNRYTRTLPPTILTTILGRDKGKSFGKDATSDSKIQRAVNFV